MPVLAVLAVAKFTRVSGLARDVVENTFAFGSDDGVTDIDTGTTGLAIARFFTTSVIGMSHTLDNYINKSVDRTIGLEVTQYDITGHLDGSPAGAPISVDSYTMADPLPDVESLPDEVAVCMSFRSGYGSLVEHGSGGSRPRARVRGRIFLGPLISHADVLDSSGTYARVDSVIAHDICVSAQARFLADLTTENESWAVWSRANAQLTYVVHGQVDNAFDSQRRRGTDPTTILDTFS